jgi:hypothetical protein
MYIWYRDFALLLNVSRKLDCLHSESERFIRYTKQLCLIRENLCSDRTPLRSVIRVNAAFDRRTAMFGEKCCDWVGCVWSVNGCMNAARDTIFLSGIGNGTNLTPFARAIRVTYHRWCACFGVTSSFIAARWRWVICDFMAFEKRCPGWAVSYIQHYNFLYSSYGTMDW